jgi:hypothetical protein
LTGAEPGIALEMPLLQDMYGASPLDSCLGRLKQRKEYGEIFTLDKEHQAAVAETKNTAMASVVFENMQAYTFY